MALTTWVFEFMHDLKDPAVRLDPAAVGAHIDFYLDLWQGAEARGFDGVMWSEHHFGAAYSPSPNLYISHVAARTQRLRLGVLGMVGPYCTPWRVVEEFAMLSHITHGRYEMGLVSGIPPEFIAAGLSIPEMAERHAEVCAVLDAARRGGRVTHHGTHWSFDDLEIQPPFRDPSAPIWTASRSPESARRAAERGWKVATGFNSVANISAITAAYRQQADADGWEATPEHIGLRRMITFTDRADQQHDGVVRGKQALRTFLAASAGPLPPFAAVLDRPDSDSDQLSNDEFISGTPEQVAEELRQQAAAIGAGHVMVMFSAMDPAQLREAHDQFSSDVIPLLR
jgi:alkanesulfonate monooxygenase SsuD/methylene tetrahydromethanopterin reductase-like flavin-dependent oxidoreductase (luciferase family)